MHTTFTMSDETFKITVLTPTGPIVVESNSSKGTADLIRQLSDKNQSAITRNDVVVANTIASSSHFERAEADCNLILSVMANAPGGEVFSSTIQDLLGTSDPGEFGNRVKDVKAFLLQKGVHIDRVRKTVYSDQRPAVWRRAPDFWIAAERCGVVTGEEADRRLMKDQQEIESQG